MIDNSKMTDFVRDLRRAYNAVVNEVDIRYYTKRELLELALMKPADSFYLSEDDVQRIINQIEKGNIEVKKPITALKYHDLYSVYNQYLEDLPYLPKIMAIRMTADGPAPRFYITADWARKVLNKYIRI